MTATKRFIWAKVVIMEYSDLLKFAQDNEINASDLYIATEVSCVLDYKDDEEFNNICELIKSAWIHSDWANIEELLRAYSVLKQNGEEINVDSLLDTACELDYD